MTGKGGFRPDQTRIRHRSPILRQPAISPIARDQSHTRGLTLIELVLAMAIFALVATMGLQALTGALRMRDRLVQTEVETGELAYALGLLRKDLAALTPMVFRPPDGVPRSAIDLATDGRRLGLSISGQPDLPPLSGPGLHRVDWRLETGSDQRGGQIRAQTRGQSGGQTGQTGQSASRLTRQVWPTLTPASAAVAQPRMIVLEGVQRVTLRTFWPDIGWVAGSTPIQLQGQPISALSSGLRDSDSGAGVSVSSYTSALPDAVELTLDTARFGRLVLIESLK